MVRNTKTKTRYACDDVFLNQIILNEMIHNECMHELTIKLVL